MELVSWKIDKYKANATDAYAEISKLNEITPQNVVDLARNEDSVLHSDFEWNDSVAGEKYRKIQAQEMIRMFVFTPVKEKNEPTRVFEISTQKNVYKPTKINVNLLNKGGLVPIKFAEHTIDEKLMSPKKGSPVLAHLNRFIGWSATFTVSYMETVFSAEQIINIINMAGFGIGIGSGRSSGFGRYHVQDVKAI